MATMLRYSRELESRTAQLQNEEYEVSDLVIPAPEGTHVPVESQDDRQYKIFGINFADILDNHESYYTETILAQLIREKVLQNRMEDFALGLISTRPGKLYIPHHPQVHKEIRQFLDTLRTLARIQIALDIRFITCKNNFFKQVDLEFTPIYASGLSAILLYSQLSREEERELSTAIAESNDASICFQQPLTLHHMESRCISHACRTDFLAGRDREQNDIIGRMYEGVIARLRPQLQSGQREISLDLEIDVAMLIKPLPTLPVAEGEIALPTQLTQHVKTSIPFSCDRVLLLAGFANPYENEGERSFAPARKKEHLLIYCKVELKNPV